MKKNTHFVWLCRVEIGFVVVPDIMVVCSIMDCSQLISPISLHKTFGHWQCPHCWVAMTEAKGAASVNLWTEWHELNVVTSLLYFLISCPCFVGVKPFETDTFWQVESHLQQHLDETLARSGQRQRTWPWIPTILFVGLAAHSKPWNQGRRCWCSSF